MKQTINKNTFADAFKAIRPDNFSLCGLGILFDYLEEVEQSCGIEEEFDVIALCCDFAEGTWQSIASDYSIEIDENESDDEQEAAVLDYLADEGVLIGNTTYSVVYRQF
jgi:hypothetical protein